MGVEITGTSSVWQSPYPKAIISYGSEPGFMPNDDKMVDVWLALHGDKITLGGVGPAYTKLMRTEDEQALYDLLTINLIERAKKYGSVEHP